MMNILALTKYSYEGPSSRYRFYNYQECFKKQGIDMTIVPLFSRSYFTTTSKIDKIFVVLRAYLARFFLLVRLLLFKNSYDLILIEYELFPYFPAFFEYLLHKRGIKYIVDYDDAIFHKYDMNSNKIIHSLLKNKIAKVITLAKHVIVCNAYLETYARKYNPNIMRLPTVVLLERYMQQMRNFQKDEDAPFVIGWIGSRTTSVYILEILPAIQKFVDTYQHVRFDLVGFDKQLLSEDEVRRHHIRIIPWAEEQEIENILTFDVGIMPLRDDPWSRGKCGFKLVQYMSCKKPVVASPVGVNVDIVEEGVNGFLVKTLDEWYEAFEKLYLDKSLREKMAAENFAKIERLYSHEKNCQEYSDAIKILHA